MTFISPLDDLLTRWSRLQPERCKPLAEPELPEPPKDLLLAGERVIAKITVRKAFMVFAPNMGRYVNINMGKWNLDDWKPVIASGDESKDLTGATHLMIAVIEAMKAEGIYPQEDGLPSLSVSQESAISVLNPKSRADQFNVEAMAFRAYLVAREHLQMLVDNLESKN